MNRTIKTYTDLLGEKERMQSLLIVQEQRVRADWASLKNEFTPVKNVFQAFGKMTHPDRAYPLLNTGLKIASDLFIRNFVLAKAGWITRLAVPFVLKNYSSHLLVDKGANFISRLSRRFRKKGAGGDETGIF